MQTMAIGFLPKTLDLDLVIWNIRRAREDKVYITPKQGDFEPFIWQHFSMIQAHRRGFEVRNGELKAEIRKRYA